MPPEELKVAIASSEKRVWENLTQNCFSVFGENLFNNFFSLLLSAIGWREARSL
jgi:hypothetical protein